MRELVLVILDRPEPAVACLEAAEKVAALLVNPRIEALHVRIDPITTILPSEEVLTKKREAEISKREADRSSAVRAACTAWLEASDTPTQSRFIWTDVESTIEKEVRERGGEANVIVLPQPARSRDLRGRQIVRTAFLDTDRPILMIPRENEAAFGRSIAILWGDDRPTTKAVLNAMPLLASATHIHVLMTHHNADKQPLQLPRLLTIHDVSADIRVIEHPVCRAGMTALDAAHEVGADLLVMGAYPHHPLPDLFTGGVTRYMVAWSDLPLFVCH